MLSSLMRRWSPSSPPLIKYSPLSRVEGGKPAIDHDEQDASPRSRHSQYIWFLAGLLFGVLLTTLAFLTGREGRLPAFAAVKEFAPAMPLKTVVFGERRELYSRPGAESDAAWNALMPLGGEHRANGWVLIPNPEHYHLQPGVLVPELGVERFSVSMYHQLHCLRAIRDFYWRLVGAVESGSLDEARKEVEKQLRYEHVLHCFAYLVQGVQCSADLSIEWAIVEEDGTRYQTDGVGMPHHQCKDPEALKAWVSKVHSPSVSNKTHSH